MRQLDFDLGVDASAVDHKPSQEILRMPDAEITIFRAFFSAVESDKFFHALLNDIDWKQEQIKLYGKKINIPRLTAWYGDAGKSYTYSGISMHALPWTETLLDIKERVD